MTLPNNTDVFILDCNASDFGIGAVISQVQNNKEKVIAYVSRSLNKAGQNYCVTERKMLAIRYFLEYFRHYLLGRKFLVRSDHQALKYMLSFKSPKGRIARWLEVVSEYDFTIEHRKGVKHGHSDGMSRYPNPSDCECSNTDNEVVLKCGPCKKCLKKAEQMKSGLMYQTYLTKTKTTIMQNTLRTVSVESESANDALSVEKDSRNKTESVETETNETSLLVNVIVLFITACIFMLVVAIHIAKYVFQTIKH